MIDMIILLCYVVFCGITLQIYLKLSKFYDVSRDRERMNISE